MMVFKNTIWPICDYTDEKYNTNGGDIFLIKLLWLRPRVGMILWYKLFVPKGTGYMHKDLGVFWLYYSQDSLQLFSWITVLCVARLEASVKGKRSSFLRVYRHDLKLQE